MADPLSTQLAMALLAFCVECQDSFNEGLYAEAIAEAMGLTGNEITIAKVESNKGPPPSVDVKIVLRDKAATFEGFDEQKLKATLHEFGFKARLLKIYPMHFEDAANTLQEYYFHKQEHALDPRKLDDMYDLLSLAQQCGSKQDVANCERVTQLWRKGAGLLDELIGDCDAGTGEVPAHPAGGLQWPKEQTKVKRVQLLACMCAEAKELYGEKYPGYCGLMLFLMRLYTREGVDIDRVLGFSDVPKSHKQLKQLCKGPEYSEWCKHCQENHTGDKKWKVVWHDYKFRIGRNPDLYREVNSAMRGHLQSDPDNATDEHTLRNWICFIMSLTALVTIEPLQQALTRLGVHIPAEEVQVYRGEILPQSVVERRIHAPVISPAQFWSTSTEEQRAMNFLKSADMSISQQPVLNMGEDIHHGLPMMGLSAYPKENEIVIPPLCLFNVVNVGSISGMQRSTAVSLSCREWAFEGGEDGFQDDDARKNISCPAGLWPSIVKDVEAANEILAMFKAELDQKIQLVIHYILPDGVQESLLTVPSAWSIDHLDEVVVRQFVLQNKTDVSVSLSPRGGLVFTLRKKGAYQPLANRVLQDVFSNGDIVEAIASSVARPLKKGELYPYTLDGWAGSIHAATCATAAVAIAATFPNFTRLDLRGFGFSGCNFAAGVYLEGARLDGASFQSVVPPQQWDLRNLCLRGCLFGGVDFSQGVQFEGAELTNADFGTVWPFGTTDQDRTRPSVAPSRLPTGLDLRSCDLRSCCFNGVDLTQGVDFRGVDLQDASFRSAKPPPDWDLRGLNLQACNFSDVDLTNGVRFGGSVLVGASFDVCEKEPLRAGCYIKPAIDSPEEPLNAAGGTFTSETQLLVTGFEGSKPVTDGKMWEEGEFVFESTWKKTMPYDLNLSGYDLSKASFQNVDFSQVNPRCLKKANLKGAVFRGATLPQGMNKGVLAACEDVIF